MTLAGAGSAGGLERAAPRGHGAFRLGDLQLALPMAALREVVPRGTLTPLPCRSGHVIGGVDLRGTVVPVLDLGRVLGRTMPAAERPCVIVMSHGGRLLGLLADGVSAVYADATVQPAMHLQGEESPLFDCCISADDGTMVSVLSPAAIAALPQVPMVGDPESQRRAGVAPPDTDAPATAAAMPGQGAASMAQPLPRPTMLMRCGPMHFAIEATAVHATLAAPALRDSPLARGACRGITVYADAEVPVVDLLAFCGLGELPRGVAAQAFVIALPAGRVAFVVDSVVDIVDTVPADVIAMPAFTLERAELFQGLLPASVHGGGADAPPFLVLDGEALAASDEVQGWARMTIALGHAGAAAGNPGLGGGAQAGAATRSMLTYELAGETATPLEQVAEILPCVPSAPAWGGGDDPLRGVLVHRGRSIPVMCLARLTGRPADEVSTGASVLVVESDGDLVGFVVPMLKGIEAARWEPALPAGVSGATGRSRPLALVGGGAEERMLPVLDLQQMARALRNGHGAGAPR